MKGFTFTIPQNIVFGSGSLNRLPELLDKCRAKKVFIISGPNLERRGMVGRVSKLAEDSKIKCEVFTDVEANPSVSTVEAGAKAYNLSGADSIIALGGGSPMDVAKAIAIIAKYGGDIREYEGADKVPGPVVPLIAIPTTAGTGSEVTAFSVITDTSRNYKLTVFSNTLLPRYAILDPQLIMSMPASVAAVCGADALVHAIEAYLSRAASPFSDAMSEKGMELIGGSIRRFYANRHDEEAAEAMLAGSMFAGISFASARLGNVHAMSHPVSAFFHVPHGTANAILLPFVLEYNSLADHGRYEKIYRYIKKSSTPISGFMAGELVETVRKLNNDLGIPAKLSDVGVKGEMIPQMAADALKSGNIAVNPRETTLKDLEVLYWKAL